MVAVLEPRVRAECPQEGLLKCVLGSLAPEPATEEAVDLLAVRFLEGLEGRYHYAVKRTPSPRCEM